MNNNERLIVANMADLTRRSYSPTERRPHAPVRYGLYSTVAICIVAMAMLYFSARM